MKFPKKQFISLGSVAIISAAMGGSVVYFLENQQTDPQLAKVNQVYQQIQDNYYDKVNRKILAQGAIKGMLDSLDDPYTTLLDGEQKNALNDKLSNQIVGIGAVVSILDNQVTIVEQPKKVHQPHKQDCKKGILLKK